MPDREKYIEVLSKTAKTVKEFGEDTLIKISLQCVEDILELLKEQEPIPPIKQYDGNPEDWASWWYVCGNCESGIDCCDKFCRWCGRQVKWK